MTVYEFKVWAVNKNGTSVDNPTKIMARSERMARLELIIMWNAQGLRIIKIERIQ